jgi:hypothetical protein
MASKPETKLQRAIQKELKSRGWWCLKIHGGIFQRAGIPDLLCIRYDKVIEAWLRAALKMEFLKDRFIPVLCVRYVWLEVKLEGKTSTPLQLYIQGKLASMGAEVYEVTSVKEAVDKTEVLTGGTMNG